MKVSDRLEPVTKNWLNTPSWSGAVNAVYRDGDEDANAPMLHLVEWKNPLPVGVANASYAAVGFNRMVQLVADLDVARAAVIAQGTQPILPNSDFIRPPLHNHSLIVHIQHQIT